MKTLIIAATATLVLAATGISTASDIYKWTDENGNVHYGDKPVGHQTERLAIESRPTDPARIAAHNQARATARTEAREAEAAAAADGPSEEALQDEARDRAKKCSDYRATMQRFVTSRRLYREDDGGNRVYLDPAETQAARQRVEDQVTEYCTS